MINSRTKGSAAEREVSKIIEEHTGIKLIRNLEQVRSGGHDLIVHNDCTGTVADNFRRLAIESKRYNVVNPADITRWWSQATYQAEMCELTPVLIYRADRRDWTAVVPLHYIRDDFFVNNELTVSMSIPVFCCIVREK